MAALQCQFCGAPVTMAEPIGREAQCESCGHDLRCCRNCRHYDPRYSNACTEPMADPVVEKDRRNFCECFYFSREPFQAPAATSGREAEARRKLEGLFGGGSPKPDAGAAREKLDRLFGGPAPPADRAADARRKVEDLFRKPPTADDAEP